MFFVVETVALTHSEAIMKCYVKVRFRDVDGYQCCFQSFLCDFGLLFF